MRSLRLLLRKLFFVALVCACTAARADGVYLTQNTRWKNGELTWYYNPARTPASVPHDAFLAAVKAGFDEWAKGCRINAHYGGISQVEPDADHADTTGQVTIGYFPFPANSAMHARGGLFSRDRSSRFAYATAGVVSLSSNPVPQPPGTDTHLLPGARLTQVLRHEIGHLLGLAHSTSPYSIMYYSWHSANGVTTPQGVAHDIGADDFTTCANLYGSNGVVERPYYGGMRVDPQLGISVALEPAGAAHFQLDKLDLSRPVTAARVLRAGPGYRGGWVEWRLVAPSGDLYELGLADSQARERNTSLGRFREFLSIGTLEPGRAAPWLPAIPGKWRLQATVDGRLAAEHAFTLENTAVAPLPRAEMAVAVEPGQGGWRVRTISTGGIGVAEARVFLNQNYDRLATRFTAPGRPSRLEVWARTDEPRDDYGNVEQDTPDIVKHLDFLSDAGAMARSRIGVSESGTWAAYSAQATIETAATGTQYVYVIASGGGKRMYRQPGGGWSERETPLLSFEAPGAVAFDAVRNVDTYDLPPGYTLHVAYGASLAQAVAQEQTRQVRRFGAADPRTVAAAPPPAKRETMAMNAAPSAPARQGGAGATRAINAPR
jgi:hypothetical protein